MVFKRIPSSAVPHELVTSTANDKGVPKIRKTTRETNNLVSGLGNYVSSMDKRDGYISVRIDNLVLAETNNRIGQAELLENLPSIIEIIREIHESDDISEVPDIEAIYSRSGLNKMNPSAEALYNNCAELANSFITSGEGYADTPPKVYPATNGLNNVKVGHRRIIAYRLAQPITGIDSIDVILDKGSRTQDNQLAQTISRATENASRVGNTLAEQLLAMRDICRYTMESDGKPPNKSLLSRQTGIERTKVGRLIEMVARGGAENLDVLGKIHNSKIEDATAVHLLFLQPELDWPKLVDELLAGGTDNFREKYRIRENDKSKTTVVDKAAKSEKKMKVVRYRLEERHSAAAGKLLSVLTNHKADWLDGIDVTLSPLEKLKLLLEKLA